MRFASVLAAALALGIAAAPAAAESGAVIRADELKAMPFIDAASSAKLPANTSVNILSRKGGWIEVQAGGQTAYANALDAAKAELDAHGRPGVQKVIVILSDGAANTGPTYLPPSSPYRTQPCQTGVNVANQQKSDGVLLYSIAYDLDVSGAEAATALADLEAKGYVTCSLLGTYSRTLLRMPAPRGSGYAGGGG